MRKNGIRRASRRSTSSGSGEIRRFAAIRLAPSISVNSFAADDWATGAERAPEGESLLEPSRAGSGVRFPTSQAMLNPNRASQPKERRQEAYSATSPLTTKPRPVPTNSPLRM